MSDKCSWLNCAVHQCHRIIYFTDFWRCSIHPCIFLPDMHQTAAAESADANADLRQSRLSEVCRLEIVFFWACIGMGMIQEMSMHVLIGYRYWMQLWRIIQCLLCRNFQLQFFWFCRTNLRDCAEKTSAWTDPQKLFKMSLHFHTDNESRTTADRDNFCSEEGSIFVGCHGPWDRYKGGNVHWTWHETKWSMFAPKAHGLHKPFHEVG